MKSTTCNLGHRLRKTVTIDGRDRIMYQCCDSRECLFKEIKDGAMICNFGEQPGSAGGAGAHSDDVRHEDQR